MTKTKLPFSDHDADLSRPELSRGLLTSVLIEAVQRIRTVNNLLAAEHRGGDPFSADMTEGVYFLIEDQAKVLSAVTNRLSVWEDEYRAERKAEEAERNAVSDSIRKVRDAFITASVEAGAEPQVIAQALNIRRSSVERVIGQLRGAAPAAPEATRALSA